jgi:hypothetical protein
MDGRMGGWEEKKPRTSDLRHGKEITKINNIIYKDIKRAIMFSFFVLMLRAKKNASQIGLKWWQMCKKVVVVLLMFVFMEKGSKKTPSLHKKINTKQM